MVDPNVYALNIELQLNTQEAYNQLDKLGKSLIDTEQHVSDAATKAFQKINTLATQINTSLQSINQISTAYRKDTQDISKDFTDTNKSIGESHDIQEQNLRTIIKQKKILDKLFLQKKIELRNYKVEKLHLDKVFGYIKKIDKGILEKNKGHEAENKLVEKEAGLVNDLCKGSDRFKGSVSNAAKALSGIAASTIGIFEYFSRINMGTEEFVTANYRAYGSQLYLLQSTRQLSAELGISQEAAIAVYKALANMKIPRDELDQFANTLGAANRITGVSANTLANFAKNLKLIGLSSQQVREEITKSYEAMRKFGLNTEDMTRIMSTSTSEMQKLNRMLGGDAKEIKRFNDLKTTIAGLGKQLGLTVEDAAKLTNSLSDPLQMLKMRNYFGVAGSGVEAMQEATIKAGEHFARMQRRIENLSGAAREQAMLEYEAVASAIMGSVEAADVARLTHEKLTAELANFGGEIKNVADVEAALARIQKRELAAANDTLIGQYNILRNTIIAARDAILEMIGEGLKEILKIINPMISYMAQLVTNWAKWVKGLEDADPVFKAAMDRIKMIVAGVVLLLGVFLSVSAIFGGFRAIGQLFAQGGSMIGSAIGNMGQAIGRNILPIIGLSIALLAASSAAYIFVQAVRTLAETDGSYLAVVVLTGAIIALGGALVLLGGLATAAAPGIAVLAGGILAIGAAVYLAGLGVQAFGYGLQLMADAARSVWDFVVDMSKDLFRVATDITVASVMLLPAAFTLLTAMVTLAAAGVAMVAAGATIGVGSIALGLALTAMRFAVSGFETTTARLALMSEHLERFTASLVAFDTFRRVVSEFRSSVRQMRDSVTDLDNLINAIGSTFSRLNAIEINGRFTTNLNSLSSSMRELESLGNISIDWDSVLPSNVDALTGIANEFEAIVSKFDSSVNKLEESFANLSSTMSSFSANIALNDEVSNVASKLNEYADLLERASERITLAVETKAIPALRSAERAGATEAIKSEAINTVKVMNEEEGEVNAGIDPSQLMMAQLELLASIKESLDGVAGENGNTKDIYDILMKYLPEMRHGAGSGLSSGFNSWNR